MGASADQEPLRVLIAAGVYPPHIGGPAIQAELFARKLAERGAEVLVLTHGPPAADSGGVRVAYLEHGNRRGALATIRRTISIARQVAAALREFAPDVVQMQTAAGVFPLIVGVAARRSGIPSWVKFAANPVLEHRYRRPAIGTAPPQARLRARISAAGVRALAALVFRVHRFVWVTTPVVAEALASEWGIARERIVVQPNLVELPLPGGIGVPRDRAGGAPLRLLVVGRLEPIKGVDVALRALALLGERGAILRIVGEGAPGYTGELRRLADTLGIADRIEWAGKIVGEPLRREYAAADLLLVPSRYEAFGSVLIEAMAAGLPIVASRVGGIPDVVQDGACASLVEPEDAPVLARAIADMAGDDRERARLREAGLRRAGDFGADAGVDKWLEIYRAHRDRRSRHRTRSGAESERQETAAP